MEYLWQAIETVNSRAAGVVSGVPGLALLTGVGVFLTLRLRGLQFRKFGYAMRNTIGRVFCRRKTKRGEVTPFQAMTIALAATVGTGNIAGVTAAVTLGGAGALFWLWVSALLGMATKYAEVVLAVRYRERNAWGDWTGGPMYYIKNGLGPGWKWLACCFSLFGGLASLGIGNAVQVGNITDAVNTAVTAFYPGAAAYREGINLLLGVVLTAVVGIVLLGGIQRVGGVTEKLVPFMSLAYIAACAAVLCTHAEQLPRVLGMIFQGAFSPEAVTGGAAGITLRACVGWGIRRGVFSNEAGLGSAPMAHAATSETDPVRQGLYGIFEVFMDTIVICSLSGLTILVSLSSQQLCYGRQGTTALNAQALGTVFGERGGSLIIAAGMSLFALSTVLSWGLYGSRCWEFILGTGAIRPYQIIFTLVVLAGATMDLGLAWDIADTLNGLMAIPNLIAVVALSGVVRRCTAAYFDRGKGL